MIAAGYSNLMDYLQTLFGFFNAPLFATFILGMFWKRMTSTAGWTGLVAGTLSAELGKERRDVRKLDLRKDYLSSMKSSSGEWL